MIRSTLIAGMLFCLTGLPAGCASTGREKGTVYRTPWDMTFVVESPKDGSGEVLRVRGTRLATPAGVPMLVDAIFPLSRVLVHLADGHDEPVLQSGELWAIYSPGAGCVGLAFKTRGRIKWFGHEFRGDDSGALVLFSSVDTQGAAQPWYLDACALGSGMRGVPWVEKEGWIEWWFRNLVRYNDSGNVIEQSGMKPLPVLHSLPREKHGTTTNRKEHSLPIWAGEEGERGADEDRYVLILWEGMHVLGGGVYGGPDKRCRVRGYLSKRGFFSDNSPEGEIVVCTIERLK